MIKLAGDIGGTSTRLLLVEEDNDAQKIIAEKTYPSQQFNHLSDVIQLFLSEVATKNIAAKNIAAACFALAGPVTGNKDNQIAKVTNLPWLIQQQEISDIFNIAKVTLLNDFMAVGHGISVLKAEDICVLQKGDVTQKLNPNAAIIGAGTGLGVAHRVFIDGKYHILPSETGHIGFAPENELQTQLLSWLQQSYKHVSLELILSGRGIVSLYHFFRDIMGVNESDEVKQSLLQGDQAQIITHYALEKKDLLCIQVLDCFVDIYAAAAGNVALHYYPVDELYIAGGIAPKIIDKMKTTAFIEHFNNKGLMASNMKNITIKLIIFDKIGLYGALSTI